VSGYLLGLTDERRLPALHPLASLPDAENAIAAREIRLHYGPRGPRTIAAGTRLRVVFFDDHVARVATAGGEYAVVSRDSLILGDDVRAEP
jgi:hypothetical protein